MYHFFFNLPKNYQNAGTVFLPVKSSTGVPAIISCYGWNKIHWPKRVDEEMLDMAVKKNNMGFVTMELTGQSDDDSASACDRWTRNLSEMVTWVRDKRYFNKAKVGLFAFGLPAVAALRFAVGESGIAFVVATVIPESLDIDKIITSAVRPTLILQGTTDKITIQSKPQMAEEIVRCDNFDTKSTILTFKGGDHYLYNIARQASDEVVKWLRSNDLT